MIQNRVEILNKNENNNTFWTLTFISQSSLAVMQQKFILNFSTGHDGYKTCISMRNEAILLHDLGL